MLKIIRVIPFPQVRGLFTGTIAIVERLWRGRFSKVLLDSEEQQE
jgi:hypothetical protein